MVKRYMYGDMSPPGVKFELSVESTSLVLFRLCGNSLIQHGGKLSCPACATNVNASVISCPACVFRLECPSLYMSMSSIQRKKILAQPVNIVKMS